MALRIEFSELDGTMHLTVHGDVDLYTSPDLRSAILKSVTKKKHHVRVNLASVTYMDSSGVATLIEGLKEASTRKLVFALIAPSEPVMKVLQLSRLDNVFTVCG